ncbi:hypothetical protein [Pedobacter sp. Leaf132]|uniref:hypothetical protein n=1 Tax=Pedobacter sp. Leaf132 TaxID=2876557 RepID=UPI001E34C22E|nr:hypothetical protein [Pedobacter sp. Leaf132]
MKFVIILVLTLISIKSLAQKSDTLYSYINIGGKEIKKEKTTNVYKIYKLNDSTWIRTTLNQNLELLKRETFIDEKLTVLNGDYIEYEHAKPKLKGHYSNGNKSGTWIIYDASGNVLQTTTFGEN